jgi:hypothetical protein
MDAIGIRGPRLRRRSREWIASAAVFVQAMNAGSPAGDSPALLTQLAQRGRTVGATAARESADHRRRAP